MGRMSRNKGKRGERELARELLRLFEIEARRGCQFHGGPGRYERRRVGATAPIGKDDSQKISDVDMNPGEPDVVTSVPDLHIECKRVERFRLYEALDQAISDINKGDREQSEPGAKSKIPVVMHRQNNKPWVAIVRLDDLPRLIAAMKDVLKPEDGDATDDSVQD